MRGFVNVEPHPREKLDEEPGVADGTMPSLVAPKGLKPGDFQAQVAVRWALETGSRFPGTHDLEG